MAKVKTRAAAKKRLKRVGKGKRKLKRAKAYRRHLLTKKSSGRKRKLRKRSYVAVCDEPRMARLLA